MRWRKCWISGGRQNQLPDESSIHSLDSLDWAAISPKDNRTYSMHKSPLGSIKFYKRSIEELIRWPPPELEGWHLLRGSSLSVGNFTSKFWHVWNMGSLLANEWEQSGIYQGDSPGVVPLCLKDNSSGSNKQLPQTWKHDTASNSITRQHRRPINKTSLSQLEDGSFSWRKQAAAGEIRENSHCFLALGSIKSLYCQTKEPWPYPCCRYSLSKSISRKDQSNPIEQNWTASFSQSKSGTQHNRLQFSLIKRQNEHTENSPWWPPK